MKRIHLCSLLLLVLHLLALHIRSVQTRPEYIVPVDEEGLREVVLETEMLVVDVVVIRSVGEDVSERIEWVLRAGVVVASPVAC